MRNAYRVLLLSAAIVMGGCVARPTVRVDQDPAVRLTSYKTFSFFDHVGTDRAAYSSIVSARLKQTTRSRLEQLGYVYDDKAPQLRVNFFLNIEDQQEVRAIPAAPGFYAYRAGVYGPWRGYPHDVSTVQYRAGTLSIDLVDTRSNALVWQGLAEGKVKKDAYENPTKAIDNVVADIFRGFPLAAT